MASRAAHRVRSISLWIDSVHSGFGTGPTQLPSKERERAELAGLLLESLESEQDEDVESAWAEEIERRVRQLDSGEVKAIPWAQIRAELYSRLDDKR